MTVTDVQCWHCTRCKSDMTCAAFPDGIPGEIIQGFHDHRQPFPGDKGILFEAREPAQKGLEALASLPAPTP